jgi:hypothetical protein
MLYLGGSSEAAAMPGSAATFEGLKMRGFSAASADGTPLGS